jgi:hypothetical protein
MDVAANTLFMALQWSDSTMPIESVIRTRRKAASFPSEEAAIKLAGSQSIGDTSEW